MTRTARKRDSDHAYRERHRESLRDRGRVRGEAVRRAKDAIKLERGCVDCGYREHPAALQFDHVRGVKRYEISRMENHKWSDILAEIAKCEVRCANCHAIRTAGQHRAGAMPSLPAQAPSPTLF